jgi:hypothetical protein
MQSFHPIDTACSSFARASLPLPGEYACGREVPFTTVLLLFLVSRLEPVAWLDGLAGWQLGGRHRV